MNAVVRLNQLFADSAGARQDWVPTYLTGIIVAAVPTEAAERSAGWATLLMDRQQRVYRSRLPITKLLAETHNRYATYAKIMAERFRAIRHAAYGDVDDGSQVFLYRTDLTFIALNADQKRVRVALNLWHLRTMRMHSVVQREVSAYLRFTPHSRKVICPTQLTSEQLQRMLNAAGITVYECRSAFSGSSVKLPGYVDPSIESLITLPPDF